MQKIKEHISKNWHWLILMVLIGALSATLFNMMLNLSVKRSDYSNTHITDQQKQISKLRNESNFIDIVFSIISNFYFDKKSVFSNDVIEEFVSKIKSKYRVDIILKNNFATVVFASGMTKVYELRKVEEIKKFIIDINELSPRTKLKYKNNIFAILNMFAESYDEYTTLLDKFEYKELRDGTEGSYGGLGILVGVKNRLLTVIRPIPNSPAFRLGVKAGDKILKIDNYNTFDSSISTLIDHMRGAPGSVVDLSILRGGLSSPFNVKLKREIIDIDPINSETILTPKGRRVDWLKLNNFSLKTHSLLTKILRDIKNSKRSVGLIVDLRGNPGGLLDQAIKISDLFLSKGNIIKVSGRVNNVETATKSIIDLNIPIIVLIDKNSASASEILAGALQDHGKAIVIGQRSFGKGTVQTVFELPNDLGAIKITIAHFKTPLGNFIQSTGIIPNLWIQPIFKSKGNQNLLGNFSFRKKINFDLKRVGSLYNKSFVLVDEDFTKIYKPDISVEIEAALKLFDLVNKTGDKKFKKFDQYLNDLTLEKNIKALNYIKTNHLIDWSSKNRLQDEDNFQENIKFTVNIPEQKKFSPREKVSFPYKIKNLGATPLERLSLIIKSDEHRIGGEVLLGKLRQQEEKRGFIDFKIPSFLYRDSLQLAYGIARNGFYLPKQLRKLNINLKKETKLNFSFESSLIEERGGWALGKLEANETAKILLKLTNYGSSKIDIDKIEVLNLSGKQIILGKISKKLKEIGPGKQSNILIPVVGSAVMVSKELGVGFAMESEDFPRVIKRFIKIKALPSD